MALAEAYKNASAALGTGLADILTAPSGGSAAGVVILCCQVSNVDGAASADVDVALVDTSAGTTRYLAKGITVPAKAALDVLNSQRLPLEPGDKIQAKASAASDLEIVIGYTEMTTV